MNKIIDKAILKGQLNAVQEIILAINRLPQENRNVDHILGVLLRVHEGLEKDLMEEE